jgi:diguanylate cyclase (GGDEF)-like protein/PAS domain S-box-containing protein
MDPTANRSEAGEAAPGSAAPLEAFVRESPFGIAMIDAEGIYRSVNAAYCSIYGYRSDELLGKRFTMVFRSTEQVTILAKHRQFLEQGGMLSGEWQVVRRDGTGLTVIIESVRVRGASGEPQRLVYVADITARKQIEYVLRQSEARFRALFETVPLGVVYHDLQGRITSANPAAQRILGLSLAQLQGRTPVDPMWSALREDGSPLPGEEHPASVCLRTQQRVKDVMMAVRSADRGDVWLRVNAIPVFRDERLVEVYASFEDISDSVLLARELRLQARTDHLTGAANRRALMEDIAREFARVKRYPSLNSCVLIADIDHFKRVNDSHGHAVGDAVLCHVTTIMRAEIRRQDTLGRYGGEEFAMLLPETDEAAAMALADRLRQRIAECPLVRDGLEIDSTVSVGLSMLLAGDATPDAALSRADQALYLAKQQGRNRIALLAS